MPECPGGCCCALCRVVHGRGEFRHHAGGTYYRGAERTPMGQNSDPMLYPNAGDDTDDPDGVSRRLVLASGAVAGAAATAGCAGGGSDDGEGDDDDRSRRPTVFVFNTGDGTVSLIDPERDELVGTRAVGLSSSFPSNQYTPELVDAPEGSLWLNVGQGVRGLSVGALSETARVETESGANWLERTPEGSHVVVSAREPTHAQFRIDADPSSDGFGEVTARLDRTAEGGNGAQDGPGPCDVTIHPGGEYAYVPDIFGDTLTVLRVDPFEIETQVDVEPVGDGPARPWMATVSPDGRTLLVEHDEGESGTESVWDLGDPATPEETTRLTGGDGLGERPLTSEIGPDSERGYVFTPGSNDITVVDLEAGTVVDRLDLGGSAFVGTWGPSRTTLYAPVQTADDVAVIDHERASVVDRIDVGPSPYGATAASVRPRSDSASDISLAMARLGVTESAATTYCIGNCACGHRL
jgi:DNA-binding beta-propeller fold protein YncE